MKKDIRPKVIAKVKTKTNNDSMMKNLLLGLFLVACYFAYSYLINK